MFTFGARSPVAQSARVRSHDIAHPQCLSVKEGIAQETTDVHRCFIVRNIKIDETVPGVTKVRLIEVLISREESWFAERMQQRE